MICTFNVLNCFKVGVFTGWAELSLLRGLGPAITKLCGSSKLGGSPKVRIHNGQLLFICFTYLVPLYAEHQPSHVCGQFLLFIQMEPK